MGAIPPITSLWAPPVHVTTGGHALLHLRHNNSLLICFNIFYGTGLFFAPFFEKRGYR